MDEQFSDEEVKAILGRAIELDSRTSWASTHELRSIASELGISPISLETALRERSEALVAPRTLRKNGAVAVLAGLGIPLGVLAGVLAAGLTPGGIWAAEGLIHAGLLASGGMMILQSSSITLKSFHLKNVAFWGGLAAGGLLTAGILGGGNIVSGIIIGNSLNAWIASSILGSAAVLAVKQATGRFQGRGTSGESPRAYVLSVRDRLLRAARNLLDKLPVLLRWHSLPARLLR